mmetsp:Transcript_30190/g.40931  ORF Transcript_30190/g.40931 Transcript_30190/m.40931 type:complete len:85 (+) Transcript_30190:4223-4477(+)
MPSQEPTLTSEELTQTPEHTGDAFSNLVCEMDSVLEAEEPTENTNCKSIFKGETGEPIKDCVSLFEMSTVDPALVTTKIEKGTI